MPQQAEGPPSSRLRSKTKIVTPSNLMDPPKRNAQTVDHHKLLTQVNQVHTVHKNQVWMANSCSTDHNCKFNNNIVLMFQDINVVKSAPFALLTICRATTVLGRPERH